MRFFLFISFILWWLQSDFFSLYRVFTPSWEADYEQRKLPRCILFLFKAIYSE